MERKEISFAPGFFVNDEGNVYDESGGIRTQYENGDGYLGVSIKNVKGNWVTYGVHRLVAQAFVRNTRSDRIEVNHIDGDKKNNEWSNLDWVTPSENNIHSEIFRTDNVYPTIVMVNKFGKIERYFKNIHEAEIELEILPSEMWGLIKEKRCWGWHYFHYNPCQSTKPEELRKNYFRSLNLKELGTAPPASPVKIMDIDTGVIQMFDSVGKAADVFGVTTSGISQAIPRGKELRLLKKKYRVQYMHQDFVYFDHNVIEAIRSGPKDVIAFNTETKTYVIYESAKRFVVDNQLSKKAVTTALKKKRLRVFGNWIPTYLTDQNLEVLKEYVGGLKPT